MVVRFILMRFYVEVPFVVSIILSIITILVILEKNCPVLHVVSTILDCRY